MEPISFERQASVPNVGLGQGDRRAGERLSDGVVRPEHLGGAGRGKQSPRRRGGRRGLSSRWGLWRLPGAKGGCEVGTLAEPPS